jgi:hypothetical protein
VEFLDEEVLDVHGQAGRVYGLIFELEVGAVQSPLAGDLHLNLVVVVDDEVLSYLLSQRGLTVSATFLDSQFMSI